MAADRVPASVIHAPADNGIDSNGCTLVFHSIKTGVFVNDCNRFIEVVKNTQNARDAQAGRPLGHEYRGEISVVGTYDDVTVEGSTWTDMNNDHELVWFEQTAN